MTTAYRSRKKALRRAGWGGNHKRTASAANFKNRHDPKRRPPGLLMAALYRLHRDRIEGLSNMLENDDGAQ